MTRSVIKKYFVYDCLSIKKVITIIFYLFQLQDNSVLKKEIEKWKEEVRVQESKASLSASRLKAELDAHNETREKLDKNNILLSETRAEIDISRQEYSEFLRKIKEDEEAKQKRQLVAEKEQSVKLMIDEAAASELVALKDKHVKVVEDYDVLKKKEAGFVEEKSQLETSVKKLKVSFMFFSIFLADFDIKLGSQKIYRD